MPSFSSPSSIRVASQDHALRLNVTHNLVYGLPSDVVHSVKGRLPKELDVLWLSDLTISLDGSLDGRGIAAYDMARSGLAHHLQAQLKANADRLGLNNVSRPFVDDADGLSKLTLTPSRPLPRASRPHANLVSLHLVYIWRSVAGRSDAVRSGHLAETVDPFSPTLFLPAEALLNRATEQFLINHLVGRYPLILGPWCKRLDMEMQYFPSIGHSIVEIMARSKNARFLSKCKRLLKIARSHRKFDLQTCTAALLSCTNDATAETSEEEMEMDHLLAMPVLTDEQVLCERMEQLFRVGVPHRRFKPAATPQLLSLPEDDDDGLLSCIPDAGINDEARWIELQEDMDVFVEVDWREVDAQSDESLINTSIPSASITTRSPLDHRESDPAANGLGCDASQLAYLEDPGTPALFANLHGPPDHHYPEKDEQVTEELGTCQVGSESFEMLDSSSERDEVEDPDLMLLALDGEMVGRTPGSVDCTVCDVQLDWDDPALAYA